MRLLPASGGTRCNASPARRRRTTAASSKWGRRSRWRPWPTPRPTADPSSTWSPFYESASAETFSGTFLTTIEYSHKKTEVEKALQKCISLCLCISVSLCLCISVSLALFVSLSLSLYIHTHTLRYMYTFVKCAVQHICNRIKEIRNWAGKFETDWRELEATKSH
jgi:hypothetical protein